MGQFTTMSSRAKQTFFITKYILLFFIVMNILGTIWVGIYNRNAVDEAKILYPNDQWTGDKGKGSSAQVWEKLCITFLVFQNIANIMGLFGAIQEHYCLSIIYSIIMFASALYGAVAKYTRGSVASYLLPFIVGVLSAIYAHQIRMENYELAETEVKTPITPIYTSKTPTLPSNPLLGSESRRSTQSTKSNGRSVSEV